VQRGFVLCHYSSNDHFWLFCLCDLSRCASIYTVFSVRTYFLSTLREMNKERLVEMKVRLLFKRCMYYAWGSASYSTKSLTWLGSFVAGEIWTPKSARTDFNIVVQFMLYYVEANMSRNKLTLVRERWLEFLQLLMKLCPVSRNTKSTEFAKWKSSLNSVFKEEARITYTVQRNVA